MSKIISENPVTRFQTMCKFSFSLQKRQLLQIDVKCGSFSALQRDDSQQRQSINQLRQPQISSYVSSIPGSYAGIDQTPSLLKQDVASGAKVASGTFLDRLVPIYPLGPSGLRIN